MSSNLISSQIEEYIAYKQALGYKLKIESEELRRFAKHTVAVGHKDSLTLNIAYQWATLKPEYSRCSKILYLSTYLGHVKVEDTYWYLTGTPELMQLTSGSFEKFFRGYRFFH